MARLFEEADRMSRFSQAALSDVSSLPLTQNTPAVEGGIGISQPQPPPVSQSQNPLENLNTRQKIGLALQNFSAGFQGRESPSNKLLQQHEQKRLRALQEANAVIDIFGRTGKALQQFGNDTKKRDEFLSQMKKTLPPEFGGMFDSLTDQPEATEEAINFLKNITDEQKLAVITACDMTGNPGKCKADFVKEQVNIASKKKDSFKTVNIIEPGETRPRSGRINKEGVPEIHIGGGQFRTAAPGSSTVGLSVQAQTIGGLGLTKTQTGETRERLEKGAAQVAQISGLTKRITQLGNSASGLRGITAEVVGGVLGQINKESANQFNRMIGAATPEEVTEFRTEARTVIAALIPETTGEEGAKISDVERRIAESTLRLLEAEASEVQIQSALSSLMKLKILGIDRNRQLLKLGLVHNLDTATGVKARAKELADLGMNQEQIISTLKSLREQRRELERAKRRGR